MHVMNKKEVQLPRYMNCDQVAEYLGVSRTSVYELFHSDGFPLLRVGRRIIVASEDLLKWITENTGKQ